MFATKLQKKTKHPSNAKKYYNSYLKEENTKSVKRSKLITQQRKAIENPNTVDIKSVIIEHLTASRKLFKAIAIRQAKKVFQAGTGISSRSPLYSESKR